MRTSHLYCYPRWRNFIDYKQGVRVWYKGDLYSAKKDVPSGLVPSDNPHYWSLFDARRSSGEGLVWNAVADMADAFADDMNADREEHCEPTDSTVCCGHCRWFGYKELGENYHGYCFKIGTYSESTVDRTVMLTCPYRDMTWEEQRAVESAEQTLLLLHSNFSATRECRRSKYNGRE